ncbi:beta-lactamase [Cyanobium sp. PCC 7001]|nr:beta-lactamase [Cyanobium sp. PCC 7001]
MISQRTRSAMVALAAALNLVAPAHAGEALASRLQAVADAYIADTAAGEKATAISISVSLPEDGGTVNITAGRVSNTAGAAAITPDTLFQIGSITKSFTAVTLLQLQAEGVLDLDDPLETWLPQYPAWRQVTLRQLLTMTSGIPSYDNVAAMIADIGQQGLSRHFTPAVLVGFVDPAYPGAPQPTSGYAYSNTNYILAGMVIEKASGRTVQDNFERRLFGPRYGLTSTFYRAGPYPPEISRLMASGYFVAEGFPGMKNLDGADVKAEDMSWGGAAGAAVSRPEEVNRWVRALFSSNELKRARPAGNSPRSCRCEPVKPSRNSPRTTRAGSGSASRVSSRPRSGPAGSTRANRWATAPFTSTCPARISLSPWH